MGLHVRHLPSPMGLDASADGSVSCISGDTEDLVCAL